MFKLDNMNFNFRFDSYLEIPPTTIGTFQNAGAGVYFHHTPYFGTVVFPTGACGLDFCYSNTPSHPVNVIFF